MGPNLNNHTLSGTPVGSHCMLNMLVEWGLILQEIVEKT